LGAGTCSENLVVIQDVTVSKVLIEGSTAVGVEYLLGNSTEPEILLAANEVILSAGVFGSSKILMVRPPVCHSLSLHLSFWEFKRFCLEKHATICLRIICAAPVDLQLLLLDRLRSVRRV
jgi:hypothetical protein